MHKKSRGAHKNSRTPATIAFVLVYSRTAEQEKNRIELYSAIDAAQKEVEGIFHEGMISQQDVEIRVIPEIDGRGLEDHCHEAIDRLHLEIRVIVENLIDQ